MSRQHNTRRAPREFRPIFSLLFENALLAVSAYLTEAQFADERGDDARKEDLLSAAETYAIRTGYLELILLVWAYADAPLSLPLG